MSGQIVPEPIAYRDIVFYCETNGVTDREELHFFDLVIGFLDDIDRSHILQSTKPPERK